MIWPWRRRPPPEPDLSGVTILRLVDWQGRRSRAGSVGLSKGAIQHVVSITECYGLGSEDKPVLVVQERMPDFSSPSPGRGDGPAISLLIGEDWRLVPEPSSEDVREVTIGGQAVLVHRAIWSDPELESARFDWHDRRIVVASLGHPLTVGLLQSMREEAVD